MRSRRRGPGETETVVDVGTVALAVARTVVAGIRLPSDIVGRWS